jgi:hypothetical protein
VPTLDLPRAANGNMTSRGGSSISYTSYNLPSLMNQGSNSTAVSYGAHRNRYKQVTSGADPTTTIYVAGILKRVTRSSGTEFRHQIHWINLAASLIHVGHFAWWWWHAKQPWDTPNSIAFSRQPWSGREAWRRATEQLAVKWREGQLPAKRARVWIMNAIAAMAVLLTSALLVGQLAFCNTCPAGFDGKCAESIGAIASSVFVLVIYYDLRIKFSGGT